MTEAKFDGWTVVREMQDIVAEFGNDYVYQKPNGNSCVYQLDGCPSCLVGHVLARLVPEYVPSEVGVSGLRHALRERGFSHQAVSTLAVAQGIQDKGHAWGSAVLGAELAMGQFELLRKQLAAEKTDEDV